MNRIAALAVVAAMTFAACSNTNAPTPQIIYVTQPPATAASLPAGALATTLPPQTTDNPATAPTTLPYSPAVVPTPVASDDSPPTLTWPPLYDPENVLGEHRSEILSLLGTFVNHVWVVIVPTFAGTDAANFAALTLTKNGIVGGAYGGTGVILALSPHGSMGIAGGGSIPSLKSVSVGSAAEVRATAKFRAGDYAGAITEYLTALHAVFP